MRIEAEEDIQETANLLVSIIVPSHNHEKYITQCIESIINQSYKNFELIVIDDGSTDNSKNILEDLYAKYNFILIFQKNHGITYTLNLGITKYSKGKYIAFCASDDYWAFNKLEKQVSFMENNRFYPMCYGKNHYVDKNSTLLNCINPVHEKSLRGGNLFNDIFLFKLHPPVTHMFRADIFKEVGLYDEKIFAEDYDMNLRISNKYNIGYLNEFLGYYRYDDAMFKINRFDRVSDSHLMAIESYRQHKLYKKAKSMVYLRKFDTFSGYKVLKVKALTNLLKSLSLWYQKRFLLATIKLFIYWK